MKSFNIKIGVFNNDNEDKLIYLINTTILTYKKTKN